MFPELEMYHVGPAQPHTTAGNELQQSIMNCSRCARLVPSHLQKLEPFLSPVYYFQQECIIRKDAVIIPVRS